MPGRGLRTAIPGADFPGNGASSDMNLCLLTTGNVSTAGPRLPFAQRGALGPFVERQSFLGNCYGSLAVLVSRPFRQTSPSADHFFPSANRVTSLPVAWPTTAASFVLHCSLLVLLILLPPVLSAKISPAPTASRSNTRIYYRLPVLSAAQMPRLAAAGPASRASSSPALTLPALGSRNVHQNMPIISRPLHPDNLRQTIYQESSPPELKIATEQKLPNIVLGHRQGPQLPSLQTFAAPVQANHQIVTAVAPSVSSGPSPTDPSLVLTKLSDSERKLSIPVSGGGAPIRPTPNGGASASNGGSSTDAQALFVLGVDPANPTSDLALPPGNRWGDFSVGPPQGNPGSAYGDPTGAPEGSGAGARGNGERNGAGAGGNGEGNGTGTADGIGGGGSAPAGVSAFGKGASGEVGGVVDPALVASLVYPVAAPTKSVRRDTLVISSGPIGGGGLNVYGALNCGKVYSVFLPMPGKNWSLQYCDKSARGEKKSSETRASVIRLEKPLVPPDVDLDHRFDFKRAGLPPEKSHRMIVLKGVISIDGTVKSLVVLQGVLPQMDEAARVAFSRWQFKPALRDGNPVEVEILVGIPPLGGDDHINR